MLGPTYLPPYKPRDVLYTESLRKGTRSTSKGPIRADRSICVHGESPRTLGCITRIHAHCRPVGPGYDKGKSERLRDEVDPTYRCNYFKWASDLKREGSSGKIK